VSSILPKSSNLDVPRLGQGSVPVLKHRLALSRATWKRFENAGRRWSLRCTEDMTGRSAARGPVRSSHLRQVSIGSTTQRSQPQKSNANKSRDSAQSTDDLTNPPKILERRICSISIHDDTFSSEDVVVNFDAFPQGTLRELDLGSTITHESHTASHDFQDETARPSSPRESAGHKGSKTKSTAGSRGHRSARQRQDDSELSHEADDSKKCLFIIKNATSHQKAKHPKLEISVASQVATAFGFKNRSHILFSVEDRSKYAASHVEISFKDEYMTRADMWRFTMSELCQRTVYKGQKLVCMGTMKAVVKNIYIQGHKVQSALFDGLTKPIFRSESARYVLFIQMSKEMWDFDSDGSGEIMFDKVISGFLPELFKRWTVMGVKHLVSVVLFTRVEYDASLPIAFKPELGFHGVDANGKTTSDRPPYKDFYRVVVNEMASGEWATILYQLKKEFLSFHRDVSTQTIPLRERPRRETALSLVQEDAEAWIPRITGGPSAAIHGNILEAINLASSNFATDYIDRDLVRTGISIVIITPGTALFEVNQEILRQTTEVIIANGIGLDIVSLSRMPLHSVPLFKYRDLDAMSSDQTGTNEPGAMDNAHKHATLFTGQSFRDADLSESHHNALALNTGARFPDLSHQTTSSYAVPNWIDVSFWLGSSQSFSPNQDLSDPHPTRSRHKSHTEMVLRCKMYELQMMGVTTNDSVSISLPYLHENYLHPPLDTRPLGGRLSLQSESPMIGSSGTSTPTGHRGSSHGLLLGAGKLETAFPERTRETFKWMDSYDNTVYASIPAQRRHQIAAGKRRLEAEDARRTTPQKSDGASLLGTSYNVRDQSLDESDATPGMAYFDRRMKERKSLTKASERKRSFGSSNSTTAASTLSKSSKSARHISFNLRGFTFTPPKAIASTEVKPVRGEITSEPVPIKNSKNRASLQGHSPVKSDFSKDGDQIKSQEDHTSQLPIRSSNEPLSQPISISKATDGAELARSYHNRIAHTTIYNGALKDQKESEKLDVLQAASRSKHAGPKLDPMSGITEHPMALSPQQAMAPWLTVLNPFNPKVNDSNLGSQFRRWQHVYAKPLQASSIKWKSLCSPAAIPITTECFPTAKQLATEYTESPYNVNLNDDNSLSEVSKPREQLLKELIYLRLTQGFQIVVGPAVAESLGHRASKLVTTLDPGQLGYEGAVIVLSMGNLIHQIVCTEGGELEVNIMIRKPPKPLSSIPRSDSSFTPYRPAIRTTLADSYRLREMSFRDLRAEYNWNFADLLIAGYEDELVDNLRFWRARFVLIPIDLAPGARRPTNAANEDNDEEIRLEGIRKLTQMWQRHRFLPPDERNFQTSRKNQKDLNPLFVEFQTRDPSAIIAAELEGLSILTTDAAGRRSHIFTDYQPFQRSSYNIATIAQEMQGAKGIKLQDRRWHWRLHWNCFIGHEFTTWLLERFQDVETREEAVDLGNELMKKGLFKHVEGRHQFRDGNYFYQLANEYSASRSESRSGWLGALRSDRSSVPSTPISETARDLSSSDRLQTGGALDEKLLNPDKVSSPSSKSRKRKFALSKAIRYDVDPRKKSDRPELVNLHYDLLHNPDSCYHIRLDWLNVTPQLIEDVIVSWATTVEKFGLKFVQVPIAEASKVSSTNPFKETYSISLAVKPPPQPPMSIFEATSLGPRARPTNEFYQTAILKRFGFVLDFEAARNFPTDVDVAYSWGKPNYEYSQFIHNSGLLLAQIQDDGTLILLSNQKLNNRTPREQNRHIHHEQHERRHMSGLSQMLNHGPGSVSGSDRPSPYASPLLRATPDMLGFGIQGSTIAAPSTTSEQIQNDLEAFCNDGEKLQEFYSSLLRPPLSPAPPSTILEQSIPTLGLPPTIRTSPSTSKEDAERAEA
jgi:hypothetical protein